MPLAMAAGRGEQTIVRAAGLRTVNADRIVLVDGRDLDPGEDRAVVESGIAHVSVERLLAEPLPHGALYVHLDVDVVDPAEMPAVSYRAAGGPPATAVRNALTRLASSGRVAAFSVTLWEPGLPGADRSEAGTAALVRPLLDAVARAPALPPEPPARPKAP
jgi:arginase